MIYDYYLFYWEECSSFFAGECMSFWVLIGLFVLITACVIFITSIRKSSEVYREVEAENDDPPFVDRRKSLEELHKEQEQFVNTLETAPKPQQPVFVYAGPEQERLFNSPSPSAFRLPTQKSYPIPQMSNKARRTDDSSFRQSNFSLSHHHHHDDFVDDVASMVVADLVVDAVESFIEPERNYTPEPDRDYSPEPSYEAPSCSQDSYSSDNSDSGSYDSSDNGCSDD